MSRADLPSSSQSGGPLKWVKCMRWLQADRMRDAYPFASSLLLHGLLFVILGLWVLPVLTRGSDFPINATISSQDDSDANALPEVLLDTAMTQNSLQADARSLASAVMANTDPQPVSSMPAKVRIPKPPSVSNPRLPAVHRMSDEMLNTNLGVPVSMMPIHAHRGQTRVAEAEKTGDVADQISGDLRGIASDGDARVVWLLDQSLSMQLDMKHLAEFLVTTLEQIEADGRSRMEHAVVAFGDDVRTIQRPTTRGRVVAKAINGLPPDPSGVENTFQSVEWCVDRFFRFGRSRQSKVRQKLLIVWTDESGDDYLRLEHTILKCRQANVRVEVIGPSAVLGAQTGYAAYQHPADHNTYYLPVHRGPDSSFPQKLQLGYWYRGVPTDYHESMRGPHQGTSPRWQGGSNLSAMLSGFSPYALTRLARETGGRYTMYDRPGDRAPFRLEAIREYMPDYRSLAEIERDLRGQPLRQLVLASAAETWKSGHTNRSEPEMRFYGPGWTPPGRFRPYLRNRLKQPMVDALGASADIERALAYFAIAAVSPEWKPRKTIPASQSPGTEAQTLAESRRAKRSTAADDSDEANDVAAANRRLAQSEQVGSEIDVDAALEQHTSRETNLKISLLEQMYQHEKSKRWRAWSDLNLGRLLMVSVRLREYIAATSQLWLHTDELGKDTNRVWLTQSGTLLSGPVSEQRLRIARMLLNRCVDSNPGTPWAVLAERELRDEPGLMINERSGPPPPPVRIAPRPPRMPIRRPALPKL